MKKLLAIILILAILLPAAVLAETDPIVGYWYSFFDMKAYPELVASIGDYDHVIAMYYFDESGVICLLENDVKNSRSTPTYAAGGKWEKSAYGYNASIIGIGETTVTIRDENLLIKVPNSFLSIKLRKIVTFNPYADFVQ